MFLQHTLPLRSETECIIGMREGAWNKILSSNKFPFPSDVHSRSIARHGIKRATLVLHGSTCRRREGHRAH